jgi:ketosteroid isomerase-like protein
MLEAFNRDDLDGVLATFAADCELHEPPEMPDRLEEGYRGHAGIRAWMENLRETAEARFEPRQVIEAGEPIVAELESTGRGTAGGVPFAWTTFAVIGIRDGKLHRIRAFLTREEALAAARSGYLYDKLKPFKERVAEDIRGDDSVKNT